MPNKQIDFYQISLKPLLLNGDNKILALKAVDNGTFSGFYDLPGGRIDTDEFNVPFTEILKREVKEEIGDININIAPDLVAYGRKVILAEHTASKEKDIHVLYLFFQGYYLGGNIRISKEHTGHEWLDLNDIKLEEHFKEGLLDGVRAYMDKRRTFLYRGES